MARSRRFLALIPVVVLILALALPAVALADDGSGRFNVFDSVNVGPNEVINGDVGSLFSSVNVQGHVTGDVFSIFSSVNVSGNAQVDGTVFSIFSSVGVHDAAHVRGDAMTVFSSIDKSAGATIDGQQIVGAWRDGTGRNFDFGSGDVPWRVNVNTGRDWGIGRIIGGVFSALFLAAAAVITVVLFPRRVAVVRQTMVHSPLPSLGVGFLGLILFPPLTLLLACTCIGGIVVLFGVFLSTLLGLVAISMWIGDRVTDVASPADRSPVVDAAVGALILGLVMAAFDMVPFISCFSGLLWFGIFCLGFGSVLLSRFGSMPPVVPGTAVMTMPSTPSRHPPSTPPEPPAPPASPDMPAQM